MHKISGNMSGMELEELLSILPGNNKDIYEDDAEDLLDRIAEEDAMKPVAAWKELEVTQVEEGVLWLNGISLAAPVLAEKLSAGDRLYAAVFTAGKELHQMHADSDDIMEQYILGFLMSHVLTGITVDIVEEIAAGKQDTCVTMLMAGIPEVCALDQQLQVAKMLENEFEALGVQAKPGGTLAPTFSSTAFFLFGNTGCELPEKWENPAIRAALAKALYESAGHA